MEKNKRKTLTAFLLVIATLVTMIGELCVGKDIEAKTLNPLIDVGDKIYVQHDSNNKNIYDLQKSDTGITTVYEVVLAEFTAGKAWTTTGNYVDNWCKEAHGATAPEDYIPVTAGEEYFIKAYGVGWTGKNEDGSWLPFYTPVLFMDDNDIVICDMLTNTLSQSKAGVTITVPEGATKMHITMYNNQGFTLQKRLDLTDEEFDNLPINRTDLENEINAKYEAYVQDRSVYKKPNKAYITFVNDDTWGAMDEYSELFIEKDVPLVLATIPELLIENASSQKETRLEVARRVEAAGGEIMAHNNGVLTQEGFSDYDTMYSFFVRSKQMFNYYGFDVNGIILAGGTGQVAGAEESERWASSIYSYSDLYGMKYDRQDIALDSAYYHYRTWLGNYKSDYDKIVSAIDSAIENNRWVVFYFHSFSEIDKDVLGQVLDYINSKNADELEVVTYKEMYEKNAAKESDIINTKTTYYVSSTGTSKLGTSKNDPMSYETANQKSYFTGDTILFKKGDTFYGTFSPKVIQADDSILTVSSYGTGSFPTISAYKIATSDTSWSLHQDGIYKIDLTDTNCFTGLTTVDANSTNIGFLENKNGEKYYNKKNSLEGLENEFDFYCDGTYLYIKSSENPFTKVGELKLATKTNLFILSSNMKVEKINLCGTGAHGFLASATDSTNIQLSYNVIEDIGGSYLSGTTRYGNGIEFYGTNVSNLLVDNNIIRNVYDVGFTIQGNAGSGKNVMVRDNVFVQNSHDSEIWESGNATGVNGYEFKNNISVNVGRGWGHEAREDKYDVAHILFWGYKIENTDIYFHNNTVYNPRRIYFIEQTNGTNIFFQEKDAIRSDYNTYLLSDDATIFRHLYKIGEKDTFIADYNKDLHSEFISLEIDTNIITVSATSDDIVTIKQLFTGIGDIEKETTYEEITTEETSSEEATTEETSTEETTSEEITTEETSSKETTTEETTSEETTTEESTTISELSSDETDTTLKNNSTLTETTSTAKPSNPNTGDSGNTTILVYAIIIILSTVGVILGSRKTVSK